ncbi:MAG: (2Fe-2S)-binding protein [Dethiobacter sp.]|jgi:bacterioferritin-associated ferredoxin|nr:(2Fe-2S)-binding protein [Dethiobacter sp.]
MTEKKTVYICRCEEVTEDEIRKAIADGARTVKGVKNRTDATMGLCQGRTCRRIIEKMLSEVTGIEKLNPGIRHPVRTLNIGELVRGCNGDE